MKNNFYKRLLGGEEVTKVLVDAAATQKSDFSEDVAELNGNEVVQFSMETIKNIRAHGNKYIFVAGGLLEMHHQLTLKEGGIFKNVLDDLGMDKTQGYRLMGVWRRCGQRLTQNPELTAMFTPEALKILSEERFPEAARAEAFELAGDGKQISIKLAKSICAKHLPDTSEKQSDTVAKRSKQADSKPSKTVGTGEKTGKSLPKARRSLLSFVGDFARLVVQTKGKTVDVTKISKPVLANVIRDTEKFLAEMRRRHALMNDKSNLTKAG